VARDSPSQSAYSAAQAASVQFSQVLKLEAQFSSSSLLPFWSAVAFLDVLASLYWTLSVELRLGNNIEVLQIVTNSQSDRYKKFKYRYKQDTKPRQKQITTQIQRLIQKQIR